ncbi:MAG: hypothetical protein CMH62_02775 [Nanoarchaeota archaeon]|nr:hypothetical protein [Nanoarchaeota archaeon]|tara:strand:- start:86 stop:691 length:606 start_codon:yes stop_codon:yes gene_type:complete
MKSEKQVTIFVLLVILVLAAAGAFLIINSNKGTPDEYNYNNFRVSKNPTIGYTVVAYTGQQPYHLQLRNDPRNVENITIDPKIRSLILTKQEIFFTLDPDFNSIPVLGAMEMANILGRRLGLYDKRVTGTVTRQPENSEGVQVVDCDKVTEDVNVVRLQLGSETKVFLEDNECIIVQGTNEWEIVRASDRLIYQLLEVIED